MAFTTVESFNRSNGALGSSTPGSLPWSQVAGSTVVAGNRGRATALAGNCLAILDPGITVNAWWRIAVVASSTNARTAGAFVLRYVDANNHLRVDFINDASYNSGGYIKLIKVASGSETELRTSASTFGAGTSFALDVAITRSSIVVRRDGTTLFAYTLTSGEQAIYGSTTVIGLRWYAAAGFDDGDSGIDSISYEPIASWTTNSAAVPVVIDLDASADIGDAGALGVARALHQAGQINLLGVTVNVSALKAPGAVSSLLHEFALDEIPVGTWKGTTLDPNGPGPWMEFIYDHYSHPHGNLASTFPDAADVLATILSARSSPDIVILGLGLCTNLAKLVDDEPALLSAAVKELWLMGGRYPTGHGAEIEWNFSEYAAGAHLVADQWPTPIYFVGFEVGATFLVGGMLSAKPEGHILKEAYAVAERASGREAWDEMTVLAAARQGVGFLFVRGTNAVNPTTGANTFTPNATGDHYYLVKVDSDADYQAAINAWMDDDPPSA